MKRQGLTWENAVVDWRPARDLRAEVVSAADLQRQREHLADGTTTGPILKLLKDYQEQLHRSETLPQIIPILEALRAEWRYLNYGFQFLFQGGSILCWWPRTNAITWQGRLPDFPVSSDVLKTLVAYRDSAKVEPAQVGEALACLVCGGSLVAHTCAQCNHTQTDLCPNCFPRAHWCST